MASVWLTLLTAHLHALRDTTRQPFDAGRGDGEDGSVTLEQVIIAAGLLAAAVGLIAIIVAAVNKYAGKIN